MAVLFSAEIAERPVKFKLVKPPPLPVMTPAMIACVWPEPMRMMLVSVTNPRLPISMLLLPVVML